MTREEVIEMLSDDIKKHHDYLSGQYRKGLEMEIAALEQAGTCEGCKHLGKWENEVEYGYPSPCTGCKRRAVDRYER